jgi:hypothetical protein
VIDDPPHWPDEIDIVPVHHEAEVEDVDCVPLAEGALGGDPENEKSEDEKYLSVMKVLAELRAGRNVILMLSDGVTSHCVTAAGYVTDDRRLLVEVMDPAWRWSSFLRAGRNVACVAADETGREGFLLVCHQELARIYRAAVLVSRTDERAGNARDRD